MKRIICAILFVLLIVGASHAQEFSTWTFKNLEVNCIKTGSEAPIDVTSICNAESGLQILIFHRAGLQIQRNGDAVVDIQHGKIIRSDDF